MAGMWPYTAAQAPASGTAHAFANATESMQLIFFFGQQGSDCNRTELSLVWFCVRPQSLLSASRTCCTSASFCALPQFWSFAAVSPPTLQLLTVATFQPTGSVVPCAGAGNHRRSGPPHPQDQPGWAAGGGQAGAGGGAPSAQGSSPRGHERIHGYAPHQSPTLIWHLLNNPRACQPERKTRCALWERMQFCLCWSHAICEAKVPVQGPFPLRRSHSLGLPTC